MCNALDKIVADSREDNQSYDVFIIRISSLASHTPVTERTFRGWQPESILPNKYDSIEYERYKGLVVNWENYIEERKKERKQKQEQKQENES